MLECLLPGSARLHDQLTNVSLACSTVIVTAAITKMATSYMLRMFSRGTNHACLLQNGSFVIIIENRDNMDTIILTLEIINR